MTTLELLGIAHELKFWQGFVDEGVYEGFEGFHQWNVSLGENKELKIWGKEKMYNRLPICYGYEIVKAEVITFENNKAWYIWIVKKS